MQEHARSLLETLTPDIQAGLYDFYDELRAAGGVQFDEAINCWLVLDRELVMKALTDRSLSSVRYRDFDSVDAATRPLIEALSRQLFYLDAPNHMRIRSLMNRAFSARSIEMLRAQIEATTDSLIDSMVGQPEIDLIESLAYPLPVSVICDLLDVPADRRSDIKNWSAAVALVMGKAQPDATELRQGVEGMDAMLNYLGVLLLEQRKNPTSAVFSNFVASTEVSDEEILANAAALLLVGHETTTNLLGNGMLALLKNPAQLALLREQPELIKIAIEELLRYDSSVQNLLRRSTEDISLDGCSIPAGSAILLVLGAANRDPKAFVDPHALDIRREGVRHVAFGHGMHACIGAALARLEAEVVIPRLLSRLPNIALADTSLEWHSSLTFRGLKRLPLVVS